MGVYIFRGGRFNGCPYGVDICEITVNEKILYDEYMRGYKKGYREGRDAIVEIFDDKMKELKNEIAEEAVR